MCGVVACSMKASPATDYLLAALRKLEYRGYDSVGIAIQTPGEIARLRTTGRIDALDALAREWSGPSFGSAGIGHTRWATHGCVSEVNAHPHSDCTGRISLVHNGIIYNNDELRSELLAAGHRFASDVDSEVLTHLIEDEWLPGTDLLAAVRSALSRIDGTWGLAVIERETARVVVAANRSPILLARSPHGQFATSDIAAIAEWVQEFRALDDGEVIELTPSEAEGGPLTIAAAAGLRPCTWRASDVDLGDYTDYMAKEIDEQPAMVAGLVDAIVERVGNGGLWTDLGLPDFHRLHVIGCGTSLNAGHVIANLVRDVGRVPVTCTVGSEAGREIDQGHALCLVLSQSGETADVLSALESRALVGLPRLALTNQMHSTLARQADAVVSCAAGPEIGVAATKTFVCQIVAGAAVMIAAMVAMNRISSSVGHTLADGLRRLPEELAAACATAKYLLPPVAEELTSATGFVFIARGTGLPYAAEGALKLKELTYLWAEHYPAGELKHGPLALIGPGTPVIAIDSADPRLHTNVSEVRARGGHVITVGGPGSTVPVVREPGAPWGPLAASIPLQILSRTVALALQRDVDKPRNLAKSVTVE
jgi:glutamine---fructose-6-phosphate transaminase (isomerizing)